MFNDKEIKLIYKDKSGNKFEADVDTSNGRLEAVVKGDIAGTEIYASYKDKAPAEIVESVAEMDISEIVGEIPPNGKVMEDYNIISDLLKNENSLMTVIDSAKNEVKIEDISDYNINIIANLLVHTFKEIDIPQSIYITNAIYRSDNVTEKKEGK